MFLFYERAAFQINLEQGLTTVLFKVVTASRCLYFRFESRAYKQEVYKFCTEHTYLHKYA